jgi:ATP-dependent Clp protease ATP-binding subunit ClpC
MQLMSIEDLAAYLGDSKRTIYKYIASGDCPPYIRITAKNIKFDRADVDAWLESKKVFPGPGGKDMNDLSIAERAKAALKSAVGNSKLTWTPRVQAVMEQAQKQARREGADAPGSEHVLLGIFSVKNSLGATILKNLGVTASKCRELYEKFVTSSDSNRTTQAESEEHLEAIIKSAHEQSAEWGHKYLGVEHLLAGILRAEKGRGFKILTDLGVTLDRVQDEATKLIVCPMHRKERDIK